MMTLFSTRLTTTLVASLLLLHHATVVRGQVAKQFCGDQECRLPFDASCPELKANHDFFGGCCHLEDIVGTGGCRVTVWNGNCAWVRKCGDCDPNDGCNIEYETTATKDCEYDRFRVLGNPKQTNSPTTLPPGTTFAPTATHMPSPMPSMSPSCPVPSGDPPASPDAGPPDADSAVAKSISTMTVMGLMTFALLAMV